MMIVNEGTSADALISYPTFEAEPPMANLNRIYHRTCLRALLRNAVYLSGVRQTVVDKAILHLILSFLEFQLDAPPHGVG